MKAIALLLLLGLSTAACSFRTPQPDTSAGTVPTFSLHAPTGTPIPATLEPIYTATPTPNLKWPVATLTIVSSLEMSGASKSISQALVNAETLRLQQANYVACNGKYKLAYQALDNASKKAGGWDPNLETVNLGLATENASVIAYIGAMTTDAAKLIIPALDEAGPMLVVSPGSSYPGLTKPVFGTPSEPDIYYPAGIRNFVRVVTTDEIQGSVAAEFMAKELGVRSVFILDDEEPYGYAVAHTFETAAQQLGIRVIAHEAIGPKTTDYQPLMWRIAASDNGHAPDAIYASMLAGQAASQLLKDKVAVLGDNTKVKFMGPNGILTPSFIDAATAPAAEGVYATETAVPFPDGLGDSGKQFVKDYQASYGSLTEPTAIYAYESMNVLLKAIDNVCAAGGDPTIRAQVREAIFAIHDFAGALGTWSFDQNGDTSLKDVTVYEIKSGSYQVVKTYK